MEIRVAETIGPYGVAGDDGERLYALIHPALQEGVHVVVDFEGVTVLASPFLNAAIGRLLADIPAERLNAQLAIRHLPPSGAGTLQGVIENAHTYYTDPAARRALDDALELAADAG